ncbi:hypothetical protein [Pseudoalteromonas sp. PS5]|uniref:hypothetical protein n=1 Tax=Pseudoalteromonas sp. PS5 TaxID=1437473 RepID=UPI000FFEDEBD|nr:hypothetical protein [Pseudoalteromonas sp. PS5]RXF01017.1 hypothetical protein D9603_14040 [Pseudoalteromonas sp. PS5]
MTQSAAEFNGILAIAHDLLPAMHSGLSQLKPNDTALLVAAKLHYAFWFATSEEQIIELTKQAQGSDKKRKDLDKLTTWAESASSVFDTEVQWEKMPRQYHKKFEKFPSKAQATIDNPLPSLSETLIALDDLPIPELLKTLAQQASPFLMPDTDAFLSSMFGQQSREKPIDIVDESIPTETDPLSNNSDLTPDAIADIQNAYIVKSYVDVPMTDAAEQHALTQTTVEEKTAASEASNDTEFTAYTPTTTKKKIRKIARAEKGHGAMIRIVRHMLVLNEQASKAQIMAVLDLLGIKYAASALPAKISDARKMLLYMGDMGLVDEELANSYDSMVKISQYDENLSIEDAKRIDALLSELEFKPVKRRT